MEKKAKIYLAGHTGLVGQALLRLLKDNGYSNLLTVDHQGLDLTRQAEVERFFDKQRPEYVILAAAKVGGIQANRTQPAEFIYENMAIQANVIHSAYIYRVKKLLFFGSACMYPRQCPQPMKEEYLLTGKLEPTNEAYAVAKIAGVKMCQAYNQQYRTNFICLIPANIYGPGDHFNSQSSHVVPALVDKFFKARIENKGSVSVWGTGQARRDFVFVEDVARATLFFMNNYSDSGFVNIGSGEDVSIKELVRLIKEAAGYKGEVTFDHSQPDGIPKKLLDVSRMLALGWQPEISLTQGIKKTCDFFESSRSRIGA